MEVINRAFEIIQILIPTEKKQWWRSSDISKELGMHASTVHRFLSSLKKHGFVAQDPQTKQYSLGLEFLHYGEVVKEFQVVENMLSPYLEKIYQKTEETCFMTIKEGDWGRTIDKIDSTKALRVVEEIGTKRPLHIGASNKVILAYLPTKSRNKILKELKYGERIEKELIQIRKKGYSIDENETLSGVMIIATPVFTEKGNIIASLSVAVPKVRMNAETLGTIISILIDISEMKNI